MYEKKFVWAIEFDWKQIQNKFLAELSFAWVYEKKFVWAIEFDWKQIQNKFLTQKNITTNKANKRIWVIILKDFLACFSDFVIDKIVK